jgi:hypothetical protein
MNHGLISELARADMAERTAWVERERLARLAAGRERPRPGRATRAVGVMRSRLAAWRLRNQLGIVGVAPCAEDCGGAP